MCFYVEMVMPYIFNSSQLYLEGKSESGESWTTDVRNSYL